ncbi:MAG: hypothetical protein DRQ10_01465 [Candidatus Hydrothermota bacterium]|nr:MAG: hypothetical protein DRQ10_01465 [Candidatus Hydrothermae bacterium]
MSRTLKITASIAVFVLTILIVSYLKIKNEIPKKIGEALGAPVSYQSYRFNILKGFEFTKFRAGEVFQADTLRISYLIPSIFKGTVSSIYLSGFFIDISKIHLKKGGAKGGRSFDLQKIHVKNGKLRYKDQVSVQIGDIDGSLSSLAGKLIGKFAVSIPKLEAKQKAFSHIKFDILINDSRLVVTNLSSAEGNRVSKLTVHFQNDEIVAEMEGLKFQDVTVERGRTSVEPSNRVFEFLVQNVELKDRQFDWIYGHGRVTPDDVLVLDSLKLLAYEQFAHISGTFDLSTHKFDLNLRGDGVLRGQGRVWGTPDRFQSEVDIFKLRFKDFVFSNIRGSFDVVDQRVLHITKLRVKDPQLMAVASGSIDIRTLSYEFAFKIEQLELNSIHKMSYGTVAVSGMIYGKGRSIRSLTADGEVKSVRTPRLAVEHASFTLDSAKLTLVAEGIERIPTRLDWVKLRSDVGLDTNDFVFVAHRQADSLRLEGTWSSFKDLKRLSLRHMAFHIHNLSFSDSFPLTVDVVGDSVYAELPNSRLFDGVFSFGFSLKEKKIHLSAAAEHIDFSAFRTAALLPFNGILDQFNLQVEGNIDDPIVNLSGTFKSIDFERGFVEQVADGALRPFEGKTISAAVSYSTGLLLVHDFTVGDGATFKATGEIPIDFSFMPFRLSRIKEPFRFSVVSDSFAIDIVKPFVDEFLVLGDGFVRLSVQVEGLEPMPRMTGWVSLESKEAVFLPTNSPLTDFHVDITLSGDTFYIDTMSGKSSKGFLTAKGLAYVENGKVITDISMEIKDFPLYPSPDMMAVGDGTIQIKGEVPHLFITGDIAFEEAYINMPFGTRSARPHPSPIRYRFHLTGKRNIFVYNPSFEMELALDIVMSKEDEVHTVVVGELNALSGKFYYLDRTFDIVEGKILLTGGKEFNPDIYIKAEGLVCDTVLVTVVVLGTFKHPEINLFSEPPMDKLDIISLIAFGKPFSELQLAPSDVDLLRQRALTLAEGVFSRELRRILASYGISISELSLQLDPWQGNYTSFTIGFRPSKNMTIRYSYDPKSVERYTFQVKYFVKKGLAVYGERDRFGGFGAGIEFELEF